MRGLWKKEIVRIVLLAAALLLALTPCAAQAAYASKVIAANYDPGAQDGVPPVLRGKVFALYDERSEIEVIKMRLQKLGYYMRMTTFDNSFNKSMRSSVLSFQKNNQLEENGRVDEPTLIALYGENPVRGTWYTGKDAEPQRPLIIPVTKSVQWYKSAPNEIGLRVTVRNVSPKKTIAAYEVTLYAEDAQGGRVHETPKLVMSGHIASRESAWTDYVTMTDPEKICKVYVSLNRVRFADGTYEIYDDPAFDCWTLQ